MTPLFLFDATSLDAWRDGFGRHGWNVAVILLVLVAGELIVRGMARRIFRVVIAKAPLRRVDDPEGLKRRADTLAATVQWVLGILFFFIGVTLVLDEIGISVTALVAGVGVVGIAIGLGAQALVRDVINGTFILMEDQYRVGDVVTVAGVSGTVMEINPRRTVLRDADGNVHNVPNGAIGIATNQTQGFSRINLDIPVPYSADIDRAIAAIEEECETLRHERPADFLSGPHALRMHAVLENRVVIKVVGDVPPGKQWDVSGELRRRIKNRLDAEGMGMASMFPPAGPVLPPDPPG